MPTRDAWAHARNVVIGAALGAAIVAARGDASFGAIFLSALGGAVAIALVAFAFGKLRR